MKLLSFNVNKKTENLSKIIFMLMALIKFLVSYSANIHQKIVQAIIFQMIVERKKKISLFTCEQPGFKTYLK